MKIEACLSIFDEGDISQDLYMSLITTFPQYVRNAEIEFELPFEHPDLQRVVQILQEAGATPVSSLYPRDGDKFSLIINRIYEESDFKEADYLTPMHINDVDVEVNNKGDLVISADSNSLYRPGNDYLGAHITQILVSDLVADRIRESGMHGIELKPVMVRGKSPRGTKNYWHLKSDVVMPPLSPTMVMTDQNSAPYTGDPAQECYLQESRNLPGSVISNVEFHYRHVDVEGMDFDLAYTSEKLFGVRKSYPVVSQRFYQMAKSLNLAIMWKPVCLD